MKEWPSLPGQDGEGFPETGKTKLKEEVEIFGAGWEEAFQIEKLHVERQ